jgi:hypothetical protein
MTYQKATTHTIERPLGDLKAARLR